MARPQRTAKRPSSTPDPYRPRLPLQDALHARKTQWEDYYTREYHLLRTEFGYTIEESMILTKLDHWLIWTTIKHPKKGYQKKTLCHNRLWFFHTQQQFCDELHLSPQTVRTVLAHLQTAHVRKINQKKTVTTPAALLRAYRQADIKTHQLRNWWAFTDDFLAKTRAICQYAEYHFAALSVETQSNDPALKASFEVIYQADLIQQPPICKQPAKETPHRARIIQFAAR